MEYVGRCTYAVAQAATKSLTQAKSVLGVLVEEYRLTLERVLRAGEHRAHASVSIFASLTRVRPSSSMRIVRMCSVFQPPAHRQVECGVGSSRAAEVARRVIVDRRNFDRLIRFRKRRRQLAVHVRRPLSTIVPASMRNTTLWASNACTVTRKKGTARMRRVSLRSRRCRFRYRFYRRSGRHEPAQALVVLFPTAVYAHP